MFKQKLVHALVCRPPSLTTRQGTGVGQPERWAASLLMTSALRAALGDSYSLLEEAGVAEYVEETLQGVLDDGGGAEDIQEAVLPFLLDAGAVAGEDEGEALCVSLHAQLQLGKAPAPAPGEEFKKLDAAISMGKLVKADEAQVVADNAEKLRVQINFNQTLGPGRPPVNSLIDEDESEEAMKRRFKAEKRSAKRLKRELRREKLQGMQREEFMRELTREPVVLHWKGGGGSGPRDILLKDAQMEIAGKQLLKDTDLTIVHGRKYGLVGCAALASPEPTLDESLARALQHTHASCPTAVGTTTGATASARPPSSSSSRRRDSRACRPTCRSCTSSRRSWAASRPSSRCAPHALLWSFDVDPSRLADRLAVHTVSA